MRAGAKVSHLGEVCEILDSRRKPITKRDRVAGPYPYYGATGVLDHVASYIFDEPLVLIGEDGAKWGSGECTAYPVCGKCWVNNHAHVIRPNRDVMLDSWVVYYLNAIDLAPFISGLTVPKLNQGRLREIPIPLPPISEQKRIVAILDEAFAGIATAVANTKKNLANARELFERTVVSRIFGDPDQKEWNSSSVEALASDINGAIRTGPFGSQLLHGEFRDAGVAVLGIDNAVGNEFAWGKRRFISEKKYRQLERYTVKPGDVIITIMGTCGRCAVIPENIPLAINTKHLCCITLNKARCIPKFLHGYFLYHPVAREYLDKQAKGSIMAGLNMGIVKSLPVRLPSLEEQAEIVFRIEELKSQVSTIESIYERKLFALAELKQSLLQKAFSGELTVGKVASDALRMAEEVA